MKHSPLILIPISHSLTLSHPILAVLSSGLPKVIFLAVAEAEGEGGKTLALEVEAKGLVFFI